MTVLTAGKPGRPTRAAVPTRRQAGAAGRGQPPGLTQEEPRRPRHRPRAGAARHRHLRAVPDGAVVRGIAAGPVLPGGARVPGGPARPGTPGGARVRGIPAVPGARRPGEAGRAGDARQVGRTGRVPDTRVAPRRSTVRLTRRGRIVVAIALMAVSLLLIGLIWMIVAARAQAADSGLPAGAVYRNLTSVVVHPGQSLWSIASQADPAADPRIVMQEIVDLNALRGTSIEPGQRLWVPHG